MKLVDGNMLSSKYFCLDKAMVDKLKMSVKASKTCVEKLLSEGISTADTIVMAPTVDLTSDLLQSYRIDRVCQVTEADLPGSSSEDLFENCLKDIGVTDVERNAIMTESEED